MPITDAEKDRLNNAVASLAMDGLYVTDEEKEIALKCIRHEITYQEAIKDAVKKCMAEIDD